MRGRSLWRDPPVASACAFCAHRMGAPRPRLSSHVQRRFLQTTRPTARPPATAAAVREDDGNGDSEYSNRSPGWGNPSSSTGESGGTWSGPSFGRAGAISNGSGFGRPAFGSATIELTEEEKQTAVRIKQKEEYGNPRLVNIFAGAGPGTHRGGRPEPYTPKPENPSLVLAQGMDQVNKSRLSSLESSGRDQSSFSVRYEGVQKREPTSSQMPSTWGSLRRRNLESVMSSTQTPMDLIQQGRAEKEETATVARYTPLTNRSISSMGRASSQYFQTQAESSGSEQQVISAIADPTGPNSTVARPKHISPNTPQPPGSKPQVRSATEDSGASSRPAGVTDMRFQASSRARRPVANGVYQPRSFGLPGTRSDRSTDGVLDKSPFFSRTAEHRDEQAQTSTPSKELEGKSEWYIAPRNAQTGSTGTVRQPKSFGVSATRQTPGMGASNEGFALDGLADAVSVPNTQWQTRLEENGRRQEIEHDREERARKREAKYAAEELANSERAAEAPTGRGKEKSKRRQQFVAQGEEMEGEDTAAAKAEIKRQRKKAKAAKKAAAPTPVFLPEYITVANLALALRVRVDDFIEKMEELGFEDTSNDFILNSENAGLIAQEYNFEPIIDRSESMDLKARPAPDDPSILPPRAPVVTIMGHVDHGKTTLLDYLRKSSVAATEHGGITQHIGAFSVPMPSGKVITFLDTPGHAAFLNMRQRGANVTDIVILVVAADDSVKPQTIEAIKHAKAAQVPIIVAINKIDKEDANIDRVKQDLARHGVEIEDFGGDTQVVCVSGKTGQGMTELEEAAVTLSEILDMRAETDGPAEGWVLEASIKSMGKVATILVRRGTMRRGDVIVAGNTWARIRCLRNEAGADIEEAGPGTPVEIDGWKEQPLAGDEVIQAPTEQKAKSVVSYRLERDEREKLAEDMEAINDSRKVEQEKREREKQEKLAAEASKFNGEESIVIKHEAPKGAKQVYFIIKGDVSGSVEAVVDSISILSTKEVQAHILRSGVGQISEFDVEHAAAAKGYLINFNTPIDPKISSLAEASKVQIIDHNIIYRLVDDIKAKMSESLPPLITHKVLGEAEVAQVFQITIKGRQTKAMAGCKVRNGVVAKNAKVRVLRGKETIFDGNLSSLKHIKKDVPEMRKGSECGMGFDGWTNFQVGDQIQSYETNEEKRYL